MLSTLTLASIAVLAQMLALSTLLLQSNRTKETTEALCLGYFFAVYNAIYVW